jgi:hypothetical protein
MQLEKESSLLQLVLVRRGVRMREVWLKTAPTLWLCVVKIGVDYVAKE